MKGDMNMKGILRRAGVPNEHWMLGRTCLEELEKDRESEGRKKVMFIFIMCNIKLIQL